MLILASATDLIQLQVGSPGTIDVHASWMDNVSGAVGPGRSNSAGLSSGIATIVPSPAAGAMRNVKTLHIFNRGTANNTVTLIHTDGTTAVQLHSLTLPPGTSLQYIDEVGFINTIAGAAGMTSLITQKTITTPVNHIDFTTELSPIYNEITLHILGVQVNAANSYLGLRVSQDGGTTWQADPVQQYGHTYFLGGVDNNVTVFDGGWDTALWLGDFITDTTTDPHASCNLIIHTAQLAVPGIRTLFIVEGMMQAPAYGPARVTIGGAFWDDPHNNPPVTGLRILLLPDGIGANMSAGVFNLYGTRGS
jgi:hypothetical protein